MMRTARMLSFALVISLATTPAAPVLAQEGWTDLLANAGPDLKGWVRGPIPPKGKLDAKSQWSLDPKTGYLVCEGNGGHEWLRWDKPLSDFIYRVEFRYTPVTGKSGYNSGVYARNSIDATVWHQAQIGGGTGGYLFGQTMVGEKLKSFTFAKEIKGKPVKPAGEWNTIEIRCQGKEMALTVNGEPTCALRDCEVPTGYVGVEAEGYRIEFRNMKVKVLDGSAKTR